MAPTKVWAPKTATKKQSKCPSVAPKVEEIARDLDSQENFHRDYIPPRKDNAHQVKEPTDGKYPLATPTVPPSVSVEGDMLGKVVSLKFVDHDITDEQKFLEIAREKYLCAKSVPGTTKILLEP
jgi:hypothetical protein